MEENKRKVRKAKPKTPAPVVDATVSDLETVPEDAPVLVFDDMTTDSDKEWIKNTLAQSNCPTSWRMVELTQDCSYGWIEDVVKAVIDGWAVVDKYHWILHDRDLKEDCKTPRDPHIHLLIRFNGSVPTSAILSRIIRITGRRDVIPPNFLNRIKTWSGAVNYLTHRDEHKPYKFVYEVADVHSNVDWEMDAEKGHDNKQLSHDKGRLTQILKDIENGQITPYNVSEHLTPLEEFTYSSDIEKMFKICLRRQIKGEREMQVMFISGPSGVGKDSFARQWCKERGLEYYCTNNNSDYPFDDYEGQPVIIWSDARDTVFKPRELHQLLDNHYSSKQKARYADKYITAQYILITSIVPLNQWYTEFYNKDKEDKFQLYRRIASWVRMDDDKLSFYVFNYAQRQYVHMCDMPNVYRHELEQLSSKEQLMEFTKQMLGGLADGAKFVAQNMDNPEYRQTSLFDDDDTLADGEWLIAHDPKNKV